MSAPRGLLWPLLFIVVGVVFLLANFGYIAPISIVALLSLWPLVLVLIGIEIAFGRRWPLGALAVDAVLIVGALALVTTAPTALAVGPFFNTGTGDTSVSAPRENARTMTLHVSGGAGSYNVSGGSQTDLFQATSTRSDLRLRTSVKNDAADVRLDQGSFQGFRVGPAAPGRVDAVIADDVPTSLTVDVGAGEFVIDLSDVKITDAQLRAGAASLQVILPKPSGDVAMSISAGASSITIDVPAGVEARVTTGGGLSSTRFENPRFNSGETSGYATGKDRVTIRITAGASSVTVR